eukprot:m.32864 g.32864  ORF g.32864 m.32864 type:complete len:414 (-) comp15083_c0_seq1:91-1332(-)
MSSMTSKGFVLLFIGTAIFLSLLYYGGFLSAIFKLPPSPSPPSPPRLSLRRPVSPPLPIEVKNPALSLTTAVCSALRANISNAFAQRNWQKAARREKAPFPHLAFLKTHKTASTTVASIFFRLAARYQQRILSYKGLHILRPFSKQKNTSLSRPPAQLFEISLQHLSGTCCLEGSFEQLMKFYKQQLGPSVQVVTIIRQPVQHFLSWFYFYQEPVGEKLQTFVKDATYHELLFAEFGIYKHNEMESFLNDPSNFDNIFFLVAERLDESLVALQLQYGLKVQDITFQSLLRSDQVHTRWDGKKIKQTPKWTSMPQDVIEHIQRGTVYSQRLYDLAVNRLDQRIQTWDRDVFQRHLNNFRTLQYTLTSVCSPSCSSSEVTSSFGSVNRLCKWYNVVDKKYEKTISKRSLAQPVWT